MTEYRIVDISDFFEARNGRALFIRDYMDSHRGPYPVYSASLRKPFGHVDSYDYDGEYLTWVMNGYGGRVQVVSGQFSANRDRGVFVPIDGVVVPDLTYLKFSLEAQLTSMAVGRQVDGLKNEYTKVYPPLAATAQVPLPADGTGGIDFAATFTLGAKLRRLDTHRADAASAREQIGRAVFALRCDEPWAEISLGDESLFRLSIGERILTAQHTYTGIPAYSANARMPFGLVASSNLVNFDRPSLIWGIDGVYDWNLIPAGEQFATTDHCGRLQVLVDDVDPEYLLHWLRSTRGIYGFDRVFRANLRNVSEVKARVPLLESGKFDLSRQRAGAREFTNIERARSESLIALDRVLGTRLDYASL